MPDIQAPDGVIRQHLIDPEICIRCDTCAAVCSANAITHDARNYAVNAEICNGCMDCVADCPTGAVDVWRMVPAGAAYSLFDQLSWDQLPALEACASPSPIHQAPASAARPAENLYTRDAPMQAKLVESRRLTDDASASEIRHIVLEVAENFAVLEGQSIGIIPPGADAAGRRHLMRLYSVASARGGENGVKNHVALTIKRVLEDHQGKPHHGLCSNHICDLAPGSIVEVTGPHGGNFLMPDDPAAKLLMICTGTGIAPMRAMLARRLPLADEMPGRQILFYGGRTPSELPYLAELQNLPEKFLDLHLAFSRVAERPKTYVQDELRANAARVAEFLADEQCYIYLCGLKGMETGVLEAFEAICRGNGTDWHGLAARLKQAGRLHIETY